MIAYRTKDGRVGTHLSWLYIECGTYLVMRFDDSTEPVLVPRADVEEINIFPKSIAYHDDLYRLYDENGNSLSHADMKEVTRRYNIHPDATATRDDRR